MHKNYYLLWFFSWAFFLPLKNNAQYTNDQVYQQLRSIDNINNNFTVYTQLDSLHKLKGLNPKNVIEIKLRLAQVAIKIQRFDEASKLSYEGIELAKKHHLDTAYATFYKLIGAVNYYVLKFPEAIKYFKLSAAIAKEKKILYLEVTNYSNIGGVLLDMNLPDSGKIYLLLAIKMSKNCDAKCLPIRLTAYRLLATLYEREKDYKKAEQLFLVGEKEAGLYKDTTIICSFLVYHSKLLYMLGQKSKAIAMAERAYQLLSVQKNRNNHSFTGAINHLAKVYSDINKHKEASLLRLEAMRLQSENFRKENQEQVNELETKYKLKEIEQEKSLTNATLQTERKNKQLLLVGFIGLLLTTVLTLITLNARQKKRKIETEIETQKKLVNAILETEEKERSRIAKDLHDGIVQDLTAIKLDINSMVQEAPENLQIQLNKILSNIDVTSKEVREISYQMMPVTLRELGLLKAIQELLNRSLNKNNIQFEFDSFGIEERLSEKIETTVYRICQELINNTIKHSQATNVSLLLQLKNNMLQLTYEDDGVGFNSTTVKKGIGLNSLNSRIEMVKGSLEFDATATTGTTAYIRIPV